MTETIGFLAAILTTGSFTPQVVRTWRVGAKGLSWAWLAMFGLGVALWLIYGIWLSAWPVIAANGLTEVQVLFIAAIKWREAAAEK